MGLLAVLEQVALSGYGSTDMKLNEHTTIPLPWIITAVISVISPTILLTYWVSTVDYRLERIENKLDLPPLRAQLTTVKR